MERVLFFIIFLGPYLGPSSSSVVGVAFHSLSLSYVDPSPLAILDSMAATSRIECFARCLVDVACKVATFDKVSQQCHRVDPCSVALAPPPSSSVPTLVVIVSGKEYGEQNNR